MFLRNDLNKLTVDDLNSLNFDIDWSKEPENDFFCMLDDRVKEIRDNHDYLVLYHSGGSDSTTVLDAFTYAGISPDEVVITSFFGVKNPALDGYKANSDLIMRNYKGKVRNVIITYDKVKAFLKNRDFLENNPNFTGCLHGFARFNLDWLERFNFNPSVPRKGKVAHIFGVDEPVVKKTGDHFYCIMMLKNFFLQSYWHENTKFFLTPKIHLKQSHMVAKYMKCHELSTIEQPIKKMIIRNEFDPLISPPKTVGSVHNLLRTPDGEAVVLMKHYANLDSEFQDLYTDYITNANLREIDRQIQKLSAKLSKEHLLL